LNNLMLTSAILNCFSPVRFYFVNEFTLLTTTAFTPIETP